MLRREFIRQSSLGAGMLPFRKFAALRANQAPGEGHTLSAAELKRLFQDPPNRFRPMVRWWWNGDRVTQDEVVRELDVLQKAGIGGVEINPIKFPAEADPMQTQALTWMSDEWIIVLEAALRGTKERGMTCDMIVGSGWPYGGEFLERKDQTQMMALGTREFTGPRSVRLPTLALLGDVSPRFVSPYKDPLKELITATLVPYELDGVSAATAVPLNSKDEEVEFTVPAGRHVLYFLVKLTGFMAVINGAPGASGPVLNHYNASSVSNYLNRISDRLSAKIGPLGKYFRAFFTDSIELEGANWCDDMLAEFRQRRGYELEPFLPFVLFKVGEMGNAIKQPYGAQLSAGFLEEIQLVRYDFETTKRELFQERFVATFSAWCTAVGVKSRMQAYGMDCDPIEAGMMIDIPECETWIRTEDILSFGNGSYDHGRSYTMINKFVSSAAHLSGKHLVSCEEMTNTDDPFHASMERIKVAGDQSILSGVTQSVLHGFNYSPLSIPFPGWVRYGTYFSERNTWWPYFKLWVDYKARLSALFQHAEMQADIAILSPAADLAARYGFQRDPFPSVALPGYLYKLWEVIHQNGGGCDYISEEIIEQATVRNGRILFRSRSYRLVILPDVTSLRPATAKQLQALVASGGKVLFLSKIPDRAVGLEHHVQESTEVLNIIATMRTDHPERTPLEAVNESDMTAWYADLQTRHSLQPYVAMSKTTDFISQIYYRGGEQDIFFFTHYGPDERLAFTATFCTGDKEAWLWDAESGKRSRLPISKDKNCLELSLGPSESKLIVFEPASLLHGKKPDARTKNNDSQLGASRLMTVAGPWQVQLASVDGQETMIDLPSSTDLRDRAASQSFAGTITYRKRLLLGPGSMPQWITLGRVRAVSEVEINGKGLGVRWYGEHIYRIDGSLHSGGNDISIRIVTTLGNYMKSLVDNPTAHAWTAATPNYPVGLIEPVKLIF